MRTLVTFWGIAGPLLIGVAFLVSGIGDNERERNQFRAQCYQNWANHNGAPVDRAVRIQRANWCTDQWAMRR